MRQRFQIRFRQMMLGLVLFCAVGTTKAQTLQPVVPFLDEVIVNPTTGKATAYFGYNNPNATTVNLRVGQPQNFMFQAPEDRGQPEQFFPGVHHYAFASIFNYHSQPFLTWILDNAQVSAFSTTALSQPQNSIFTYQGRLNDGANSASGTYQMQFALYDAATGGTQIGTTLTNTSVSVSGGLFSVQLNFGSSPFTGADRYLEIAVKRAADTDYTTLAPRQQLTAAPFAIHTINATSADTLSNACLGCVTNSQIGSVAGNKISGNVANADNATTAVTAGNVSGIVSIANGGTGSPTQNFVDLSTDQSNIGGDKTFTGVLSGNGSGLTNVPAKFPWQVVTGTSQQAVANTGYLTTGTSETTITLPVAPNVGDIVRVSDAGAGWRISQNAGQSILARNLDIDDINWTARESNRNWRSVASSANGRKLVAVAGNVYTSNDSGISWTLRPIGLDFWSVASSADGSKLVAVVRDGRIYTSGDSGVTWTGRDSNRGWRDVASSADGTKLVAVASNGQIYTSTDSGITWIARASNRAWSSVASSEDGSKLVAAVSGGQIYTSTNSGISWTAREISGSWLSVASSADGTKLIASAGFGYLYASADSGATWQEGDDRQDWSDVASSADGNKLVALVSGGQIYTSADSGFSWIGGAEHRVWKAVASSADGKQLVAFPLSGQIYVGTQATTLGSEGYLLGGPLAAVELQYIGNGQFLPLSHEGTITGH